MSFITLNEQIIDLDKIIDKNIKNINFRETISLVFHAAVAMTKNQNDPNHSEWKALYYEFESQLIQQDKQKWPHLTIVKNDYNKRIDIIPIVESFVESNNIFMLLLKLLYIENYKRPYVYKSYNYPKILSHKIKTTNNTQIEHLSLADLFELLEMYINYYNKIYYDDIHENFEHRLGKRILNLIN